MKDLSDQLRSLVDAAEPMLVQMRERETRNPLLPGGWSRKQILGHLIDSASNNHQRFVRAILQPSLDFPGYDQDGNVRAQAVQEADWRILVPLWASYNRYLAHIMEQIPPARLETSCRIGAAEPVTLAFLASDYLLHLHHHLRQIGVAE
jgi:DinB superfamily